MNLFGILGYIVTGGFLAGYRSYILGGLLALQAVASYLVGDMSLVSLLQELPELLGGLGIAALAAHVDAAGKGGGDA